MYWRINRISGRCQKRRVNVDYFVNFNYIRQRVQICIFSRITFVKVLRNQYNIILIQNEINEGEEKDYDEGGEDDDGLDFFMDLWELFSVICYGLVILGEEKILVRYVLCF